MSIRGATLELIDRVLADGLLPTPVDVRDLLSICLEQLDSDEKQRKQQNVGFRADVNYANEPATMADAKAAGKAATKAATKAAAKAAANAGAKATAKMAATAASSIAAQRLRRASGHIRQRPGLGDNDACRNDGSEDEDGEGDNLYKDAHVAAIGTAPAGEALAAGEGGRKKHRKTTPMPNAMPLPMTRAEERRARMNGRTPRKDPWRDGGGFRPKNYKHT